jgi:large subunit ribosomal protein L30
METKNKILALIRISGQIKIREDMAETLYRLGLRKKYTCVLVQDKPELLGMIEKIRNFIAIGEIDENTLIELIKVRGKKLGTRMGKVSDPEKVAKEVLAGKTLEELKIKPFFGLHPPRGGVDTKHHYPKGVLGENAEINKLIMRML